MCMYVFMCVRVLMCVCVNMLCEKTKTLLFANRANDRYFEHSKHEYHEPHKDSWD